MALRRGRGVAAINYPTGMNLGGDPSQALVHSTPTGAFMVTLSSVDLGQGLRQVMAQICAETIGIPTAQVTIDTADTDTGPHCMGTFASRGTHRIGNAVAQAAREARQVMLEVAAEALEVDAGDLDTDGKGMIHVKGAPQKARRRSRSRCSTRHLPRISNMAARSPAAACSSCRALSRRPRLVR
jgi:CO/xanthine dehydrogenase Mo-binding subunit